MCKVCARNAEKGVREAKIHLGKEASTLGTEKVASCKDDAEDAAKSKFFNPLRPCPCYASILVEAFSLVLSLDLPECLCLAEHLGDGWHRFFWR